MVQINVAASEVNIKIAYFSVAAKAGQEVLNTIKEKLPAANTGKIVSISTQAGQTMFFDFLPVTLGKINDYKVNLKLYAAPEACYYEAPRKLVLTGADAVIFIADPRTDKQADNKTQLAELETLIAGEGRAIPVFLQWNYLSRELEEHPLLPPGQLEAGLNLGRYPTIAVSTPADVMAALKEAVKQVIDKLD